VACRPPFAVLVLLPILLAAPLRVTAAGLQEWRAQLKLAQDAADSDAEIELARRIVAADPRDTDAWTTLVESQIKVEDYDRAFVSLQNWQNVTKPEPAAIDSYRGDIYLAKVMPVDAERAWRSSLKIDPHDYLVLSKLADLLETESRWDEVLALRTQAADVKPTAALIAARAGALLNVHQWDAAIAQIRKANDLDATDPTVQQWLPKIELLATRRSEIMKYDGQLRSANPADPKLVHPLLDQAQVFMEIGEPLLALANSKRALAIDPGSVRARIQCGEAELALKKPLDAAKFRVSHTLNRDNAGLVDKKVLHELDARDAAVHRNPGKPAPLAARSKTLRSLDQYVLALDDAQAALALDANSPDAQFEMGHDLDALGRSKEALPHIIRATELRPNDPVAWYYRGVVEANRSDFNAAIASQTRSLAIHESKVALRARIDAKLRLCLSAQATADLQRLNKAYPTAK
jgi:tetratricopeptide (TPR) repeat protein